MTDMDNKVLVNVAPVSAEDKVIIPEKIAEDVYKCYKAGAAMVHLHVRDREGRLTPDMSLLEETLAMIRRDSDIIIEVSTGGVEACSLNVGSTNLGKAVYCNPIDDVEYCIREILKQKKTPEVETFEIGHTWTMARLMEKYDFADPVLFSVVLGHEGEAPATPQALAAMIQMIPSNAVWGITQAHRKDFSLLAGALGMGARTVRIGFEDSNYLDAQTQVTSNAPLVEKTVKLLRAMDKEPMLPDEARELFRIGR